MGDFKSLWQQRFSNYLKEIGKYARLIMNDHFSIILLVILAFGALYYRELLIQLQALDLSVIRWVIILSVVIWLATIFQFGQPIWFTKDPDKSYLFALGEEWHSYWLKGALVSLVLPAIIISLGTAMIMPFLDLISVWSLSQSWLLILYMVAFKAVSFSLLYLDIFNLGFAQIIGRPLSRWHHTLLVAVALFITFSLPVTFNIYIPLVMLLLLIVYIAWAMTQRSNRWVAFDHIVEEETRREASLYKWISIFADVPHLRPSIKRRPYLDGVLSFMKNLNNNRYSFLFLRAIFRNNAYSGVWLRVTLFISVLIMMTSNIWMLLGMGILSHVLTFIQLVPLMKLYSNQPFQIIYPNREGSIVKAFQGTSLVIAFIQLLVYAVIAVLTQPLTLQLAYIIMAWIAVAMLMIFLYVPWWYKKQTD